MKSFRISIGVGFLAVLLAGFFVTHPATAQQTPEPSKAACRDRVVSELGAVHDEFRGRMFGARRDSAGKISVLTGGSSAEAHPGILETKGRLTSELVTPIVESYRAYRCRSIDVCTMMEKSMDATTATITVRSLGCEPETMPRYTECAAPAVGLSDKITLISECGFIVDDSLMAERAALRLAVSYDSGYRATLQLGGMIEWMQQDLPSQAIRPLRAMINMLGKLHEIPCFIGQCDDLGTSKLVQ